MDFALRRSTQRSLFQQSLFVLVVFTGVVATVQLLYGHNIEIFPQRTCTCQQDQPVGVSVTNITTPQQNRPQETQSFSSKTYHTNTVNELDPYCSTFRDAGNVAVVVKTGATNIREKLVTQLTTSLRCIQHTLILSDLEQQIEGYEVHDVLSRVTPSVMKFNNDFDLYRMQKEYKDSGREDEVDDLRLLPIVSDNPRAKGRKAAWGLDKYKFLHMIERSWELQPDKDWYVFMDADTYLNWPNLMRWLSKLDAARPWYIGHPILMMEYPLPLSFAHGGAGIILSGIAVKSLAVDRKGIAQKWDERISKMWFGDAALAAALQEEIELNIVGAHLSLTENEPRNTAFREELWCRPVLTLHHCGPTQFKELQDFEEQHHVTNATTFRDLYHFFNPKGLPEKKNNWHNLARDDGTLDWTATMPVKDQNEARPGDEPIPRTLVNPHDSMDGCRLACELNGNCFQYMFQTTVTRDLRRTTSCHHSKVFREGTAKHPEVNQMVEQHEIGQSWQSGWLLDRIDKWVKAHDHCDLQRLAWPAT